MEEIEMGTQRIKHPEKRKNPSTEITKKL